MGGGGGDGGWAVLMFDTIRIDVADIDSILSINRNQNLSTAKLNGC